MDLELSDDESALRDNVRSVLTGICPPSAVRAIHEGKGDSEGIWARMVDLSWPALAIAEEHGGLGMGFVEVAIVAEELGRLVVPGPFLATVTQFAPAVRELDARNFVADGRPATTGFKISGGVAAGEVTGAVALAEGAAWSPEAVTATATPQADGGWVLAGRKGPVPDGATADEVLVIARGSGAGRRPADLGAFLVPGRDLAPVPRSVLDPTMPQADLVLDGVVVPPDRVLAAPGEPGVGAAMVRAGHEATVALATATVGTCRAILEQTVAYAKVREQYGRPIGSFQALKHRLADMYLAVERATALCYYAVLAVAEDVAERDRAASMAKAAAGECQRLLVRDGLQLHGGIGMTWEHDLHFLLKRATAGDVLYGSAVHHRAHLARVLGLLTDEEEGA